MTVWSFTPTLATSRPVSGRIYWRNSKHARFICESIVVDDMIYETDALTRLVCSDVISRGVDVSHVSHVVSYDAPVEIRKYVHRVGRTARAGRAGDAWTLVEEQEVLYLLESVAKLTECSGAIFQNDAEREWSSGEDKAGQGLREGNGGARCSLSGL